MKYFIKCSFITSMLLFLFFAFSCSDKNKNRVTGQNINEIERSTANHVEVIYFHGGIRCAACVAMEKFGRQAIDSVFSKELQNGSLVFRSIDLMEPEGEKLGDKYEVASSSFLIIGFKDGEETVTDMTAFGFRNAKDNRNVFKQGVIDEVNRLLK
ncbi:MAG: thioredoxin [Muribaculaceae bacterium]|nr:thioredoxin [Muribaculaceae bacterium]